MRTERTIQPRYADRADAGRRLATYLEKYAGHRDVIVLALPRGGVPVGFEVAQALDVPLDVFVVRKLGLPWQEELAVGAIASGGAVVLNDDVVRLSGITREQIDRVTRVEEAELRRREQEYRGDRPFPDLTGKTVILVDDGLATGATMRAAVEALRREGPARVVVAVPVAAGETCRRLETVADDVVCAMTPDPFEAVGLWYHDFAQTSDAEVQTLLLRARAA
ncbi:MAG TPA: phosphoribosyltransferase [Gemmatimonadaceae bacterium]|nr:phosphoribosyltransferase [Gemmatimonadaceae bacterium]